MCTQSSEDHSKCPSKNSFIRTQLAVECPLWNVCKGSLWGKRDTAAGGAWDFCCEPETGFASANPGSPHSGCRLTTCTIPLWLLRSFSGTWVSLRDLFDHLVPFLIQIQLSIAVPGWQPPQPKLDCLLWCHRQVLLSDLLKSYSSNLYKYNYKSVSQRFLATFSFFQLGNDHTHSENLFLHFIP